MIKYEELYEIVKEKVLEKRFKHSEYVVKRALEYAEIYNVNKDIVKLCAIAHDIAKNLTKEENRKYIKKYNIRFNRIEKTNPNLWHSKIGAEICKEEYGFTEDMVNAIKYHTTGRANMSILEKIIYLADATEETRNYKDVQEYVDYVINDIDDAMFKVSKLVIEKLINKGVAVHLDTVKCYNYYNSNKNHKNTTQKPKNMLK